MERVWEEVVITIWGNILAAEYYKIKGSVLWKTTSKGKFFTFRRGIDQEECWEQSALLLLMHKTALLIKM